MANWLNETFFNFDRQFFIIMNEWQNGLGKILTPFFKFVSFFGESGIFLIVLSLILLLFKNSRKVGLAMLLSIAIGGLFTNLIIKNAVARVRPFFSNELYLSFWKEAGSTSVSEFSFPSGHTTVAMTSMTALFLSTNKKKSWLAYIFVVLTGLSRTYLIVHYLTDVLAGLIVGGVAGVLGNFLCKYLFGVLERNKQRKFCNFVLNADVRKSIKK